jgi:TRAP transporter TAXI family solute receptor
MRYISYSVMALFAGLMFAQTPAEAQVFTIGSTNPGGLVHSLASAVAKVLVDKAGMKVVVVPQGGETMPGVATKEIECGVNSLYDMAFYVTGTSYFSGKPKHENVKLVAALLPARLAGYVRANSNIQSVADLKGKRVPSEFNAQESIRVAVEAYLANGGVTWKDVKPVPTQSIVRGANDTASGQNDVFFFSVGAGKVAEVDASVNGGLRALSLEESKDKLKALRAMMPGAYFRTVEPAARMPYVKKPITVLSYDLVLACDDGVSDDVIYKIVKTLHDNKPALIKIMPAMRLFDPNRMNPEAEGVKTHSGALKFYKEMH